MNARRVCLALLASLALTAVACDDDPVEPEPIRWTTPDELLKTIMAIYNDREHSATERLDEYEKLFLHASDDQPGFRFNFQASDIDPGLPPSWGLESELEAHRRLFDAQADGHIYSLYLRMTYGAAERITGEPDRVDWEEIFASNVYLRLMFNPNDGLEVNGSQAEFKFAPDTSKPPVDDARFYGGYWIAEWTDLPRPAPLAAPAVEPTTWGWIKASFMDWPWPTATPEQLVEAMQVTYNDRQHSALERLNEYGRLFQDSGFAFHLQPSDIAQGLPPSWGLNEELEAHRGLFTAQENGEVYSLDLRITHGATERIMGDPERVDWERIFASHVFLRLMFNPNDGLEVNGGQADFKFAPDLSRPPAEGDRFYGSYWIADWTDLPRPAPLAAPAVESATWGSIKNIYR